MWFDRGHSKRKRELEEETITKHVENLLEKENDVLDEDEEFRDPPHLSNGKKPAQASQLRSVETSTSAFKRIRLDEGLQSLAMEDLVKLWKEKREQKGSSTVQPGKLLRKTLEHVIKEYSKRTIDEYLRRATSGQTSHEAEERRMAPFDVAGDSDKEAIISPYRRRAKSINNWTIDYPDILI